MKDKNRVCPLSRANHLDIGLRKLIHNPQRILGDYVDRGMTVLDVGCGSGYFSIPMAEMVGRAGKVIAADLQEGMLEKVGSKISGNGFGNIIELHKCDENRIGISEKVDFILAFYMVHEVPDQKIFLEEIRSVLKEDGILLIVEPKGHVSKTDFDRTVKNAIGTGFTVIRRPKVYLSRSVVLKKVS